MKKITSAFWIAVLASILGLGCGSSTGKNLYKDKDKPKPAEKEITVEEAVAKPVMHAVMKIVELAGIAE